MVAMRFACDRPVILKHYTWGAKACMSSKRLTRSEMTWKSQRTKYGMWEKLVVTGTRFPKGVDVMCQGSVTRNGRPHTSWRGDRARANRALDSQGFHMTIAKDIIEPFEV